MRVPSGYREESFYMSLGTEYWNARDIRVPVLILRGELDFWSRPQDAVALEEALTHSPRVKMVTIPQGTHYLFLDRPKRGRRQLMEEMIGFLGVDQKTY